MVMSYLNKNGSARTTAVKLFRILYHMERNRSKFTCSKCGKSFKRKLNMTCHVEKKVCSNKNVKCKYCMSSFTTNTALNLHLKKSCVVFKSGKDVHDVRDSVNDVDDVDDIEDSTDDTPTNVRSTKRIDRNANVTDQIKKKEDDVIQYHKDVMEYQKKVFENQTKALENQTKALEDIDRGRNEIMQQKKELLQQQIDQLQECKKLIETIMGISSHDMAVLLSIKNNGINGNGTNTNINNTCNNIAINNDHATNINGNVTVNITLPVPYGTEDLNELNPRVVLNSFNKCMESSCILTKNLHFNKDLPQFQNVFVPDIESENGQVFDGTKWREKSIEDLISELNTKYRTFMIDQLNVYIGKMTQKDRDALFKWISLKDGDKKQNFQREKMKLLLRAESCALGLHDRIGQTNQRAIRDNTKLASSSSDTVGIIHRDSISQKRKGITRIPPYTSKLLKNTGSSTKSQESEDGGATDVTTDDTNNGTNEESTENDETNAEFTRESDKDTDTEDDSDTETTRSRAKINTSRQTKSKLAQSKERNISLTSEKTAKNNKVKPKARKLTNKSKTNDHGRGK